MELISSLLLLIDRAISLIKQRETRPQLLVKEIIEPMFEDLESVHKEYNVMLQKLAGGIANETSEEKVLVQPSTRRSAREAVHETRSPRRTKRDYRRAFESVRVPAQHYSNATLRV